MKFRPNSWWWLGLVLGLGEVLFWHTFAILAMLAVTSVLSLFLGMSVQDWILQKCGFERRTR